MPGGHAWAHQRGGQDEQQEGQRQQVHAAVHGGGLSFACRATPEGGERARGQGTWACDSQLTVVVQ